MLRICLELGSYAFEFRRQVALASHPTDGVVIVSQAENQQLKAGLLESINRTRDIHQVLHLFATMLQKTGPLGKASFL